jgi:predicted transcriptional regulator
MGKSSFLENYDACEDTIRKLYDSRLRLSILDALKDGPLRLADLRREVDANAPNTSAKAKELEEMGLIERVEGDFVLTLHGRVTLQKITEEAKFYATYEKFKDYWQSRRLDFIPDEPWSKIGMLHNSEVIKSPQTNTTHTHDHFVKNLLAVKKTFNGISPIYHQDYINAIKQMMQNGVVIELIVTSEVFSEIAKRLVPEELKLIALYPKIKIYLCERLDSGISVSESFSNLCIVSKTDVVSLMDQYLHSTGPDAVSWGTDLFNYYKERSKPVKLSDYI